MAEASEGMTPGVEECNFGTISRGYPIVNSPTGIYVYSIDKLYAKPNDGSAGWRLELSGELFYNGTARPVFDWYNARTNQIAFFGNQDSWNVNSSSTATIVQFVWDDGIWYHSDENACA